MFGGGSRGSRADKNVALGKVRSARRLLTVFEMLGLLSVAVTIIVVLLY